MINKIKLLYREIKNYFIGLFIVPHIDYLMTWAEVVKMQYAVRKTKEYFNEKAIEYPRVYEEMRDWMNGLSDNEILKIMLKEENKMYILDSKLRDYRCNLFGYWYDEVRLNRD